MYVGGETEQRQSLPDTTLEFLDWYDSNCAVQPVVVLTAQSGRLYALALLGVLMGMPNTQPVDECPCYSPLLMAR